MCDQDFKEGIVWACARLIELHDQPSMAADVLLEARIKTEELSRMAEYDLEFLRNDSARQDIPKGID